MDVFVVRKQRDGEGGVALTFTHYEEVPKPQLLQFMARRDDFSDDEWVGFFTLQFTYGKSFSRPGNDVFGPDRVQPIAFQSIMKAQQSPKGPGQNQNFIHPLITFYRASNLQKPRS